MSEEVKIIQYTESEKLIIVKALRTNELLSDMMDSDMDLYTRILDTPGFAYAFNELVKLAMK